MVTGSAMGVVPPQPTGAEERNTLSAEFQCVARYDPAVGVVLK
jgi:hypothetical protein